MRGVRDEPLAPHTSFRIGGPADVFLSVRTSADLLDAVTSAQEMGLPIFLLGGGTNLLVADKGIRAVVIENKVSDVTVDATRLIATSGTPMAHVAAVAARAGVAGLEYAATIPGTVGGAVHGNSGAFGTNTGDVLEEVVLSDYRGSVRTVSPANLDYRYRHSALQGAPLVVLQATFRGQPSERHTVVQRIKEMANERLAKQPLDQPNTGSIFKNPPKDFAGRLVEAAGLKGLRVGGAVVSEKHGNFIVNTGSATAADVRALIAEVQRRVHESFGVMLEPEVEFVGEWEEQVPATSAPSSALE